MIRKNYDRLLEVLVTAQAECIKAADNARGSGDTVFHTKSFQTGAASAYRLAIEYVKDAQAGVL